MAELPRNFHAAPGRNNYRSGVIWDKESMELLRDEYGIKRIVDLRADAEEAQWAADLGIEHVVIPQPGWHCSPQCDLENCPGTGWSDHDWKVIRSYINKGDTLVHCTWGVDRTGAVFGRYQMETEPGFDIEDAVYYIKDVPTHTDYTGGWGRELHCGPYGENDGLGYWVSQARFSPTQFLSRHRRPAAAVGISLVAIFTALLWPKNQKLLN